jgi:capsular exopolysaccharide synthesis family protein
MDFIEKREDSEGGMEIRDIVLTVLRNWHWFVLSALACLGAAWFYLATLTPVYQRTAVILVKSEGKSADAHSALLELNSGFSSSGVENDIYILHSHQLMLKVVGDLRLDIGVEVKNRLRRIPLYAESPVRVDFPASSPASFAMGIVPLDSLKFRLESFTSNGIEQKIGEEKQYGESFNTPAGEIVISPVAANLPHFLGKTLFITRTSLDNAANSYQSRISTSLVGKNTTLVKIDCSDMNVSRAGAILNSLIDVYNETIIEDKNRIAANTAGFIEERIAIISKELGEVEEELTDFRQRNRIIDISSSASQYLHESSQAKAESIVLETQLSVARYIKNYLSDAARKNQFIPNVSGIGDIGIQGQINSYNELLQQRDRVLSNSGENNPVVQDMNDRLASMRETISGSMENYINTLRLRQERARSLENQSMGNIQSVPKQEKMALSIMRQQAIKETLYTFLLNKREENALQLAITVANIRVVEIPFGSGVPIAPKRNIILLAGLLIGLLIPSAWLYLKLTFDTRIRSRRDVEARTTIPVLGEIPQAGKNETGGEIVVRENANDRQTEAFRLLRANFSFLNKQAKVICFTSTLAGEGKTFVSRNFAVTLALSGKKVLLVDADLRKATQSKEADIKTDRGLSTCLSETYEMKEVIIKKVFHDKVDMIPSGAIPPNPAELLMSERFDKMIATLKEQYDYILVDSVPAQIIADAVIANRVADITLYIIRDGKIDRRYLPELERMHREGKYKNLCVVLNGCDPDQHRYGYGGYYGGYGYYQDTKKRPWYYFGIGKK